MANRANEDGLRVFALRSTAAHVAARAYAKRSLHVRRDPHRHTVTITVELPLDTGELVEKALDKARDAVGDERYQPGESSSITAGKY